MAKHEITIDEVKALIEKGVSTFSLKDDSPRGCTTIDADSVKVGDQIVIDNYFTTVVPAENEEPAEKIIDRIKFNYIEADEQKDLFSPSHMLYKCRITYGGRRFTFPYQCNPDYKTPNKKDCLYAIFSDADCYEMAADVDDFLQELGYADSLKDIRRGEKAYKSCRRTAAALDRIFTSDEREAMNEFFREY